MYIKENPSKKDEFEKLQGDLKTATDKLKELEEGGGNDDAQKKRAMARLKIMLVKRVTSKLDGVRVDLKDKGWVLVRPSGTEPLIRLYAEGRTEQHLSDIVNEFRPMVLQSLKG